MQKIENSLSVSQSEEVVETASVKKIIDRALLYLQTGFHVHLSGPTGTGKSTLAMHLAYALHQPFMVMYGDEEYTTADLVGNRSGYHKRKVVDNFIHSVVKTDEDLSERWVDNRLTTACKQGLTLVYDEFNRSRPEANNALLSVLEEGILTLPLTQEAAGYIKVHPNFRAIFTSNPQDYVGVHKTQDALLDRLLTIHVDYFDEETERAIVAARAGIAHDVAAKIVGLLRDCRQLASFHGALSLRPAITIGKIISQNGVQADKQNSLFVDICVDTLISARFNGGDRKQLTETVIRLIGKHF